MSQTRAAEIAENLNEAGVPPKFETEIARLLVRVMRTVADGQPVGKGQLSSLISEVGIEESTAEEFLRTVTERDDCDNVIGIVGLSQNPSWPHAFRVNGRPLQTWCAWDALFIPLLLDRTASVESTSPVLKTPIHLTVGPDGVRDAHPADAVVSVVALDPAQGAVEGVEDAWSRFCHQVYFFGSRREAEIWASERSAIELLTLDEAFELGRHAWAEVLKHASD